MKCLAFCLRNGACNVHESSRQAVASDCSQLHTSPQYPVAGGLGERVALPRSAQKQALHYQRRFQLCRLNPFMPACGRFSSASHSHTTTFPPFELFLDCWRGIAHPPALTLFRVETLGNKSFWCCGIHALSLMNRSSHVPSVRCSLLGADLRLLK